MARILAVVIGCVCLISLQSLASHGQKLKSNCSRKETVALLLKDYDASISPSDDEPTNVGVQVYIGSVDSFDEAAMDYSLTIYLRQRWLDPRLSYEDKPSLRQPIQLDARIIDNVWVPDLFFMNEKDAKFHTVTVSNRLFHIYRNGSVFYSLRLSLTLSCNMDLAKYPLDTQICPIFIESYGYTTEYLTFNWFGSTPVITDDLIISQFKLKETTFSDCTKSYGGGAGNFTCLRADLRLDRDTGYYILQIYVPSILIVILSWVSFWLNVDAIPARISLGVLTILTLTTQSSSLQASLPRVSYAKALDVWMALCLCFVFAALLEFAFVNVLSRHSKFTGGSENDKMHVQGNKKNGDVILKSIGKKKALLLDKVSRLAFPLVFGTLNIIYWTYYSAL